MISECGKSLIVLVDSVDGNVEELKNIVLRYAMKSGGRRITLILHKEAHTRPLELIKDSILNNHVYSLIIYELESRGEALELLEKHVCNDSILVLTTRDNLEELSRRLDGKVLFEVV
ncbi:hypothetical protein Desfe_0575 [Desulfurococcus amylolyticus DSM 16532]|uniref:Uncharacterized protein n=1 Tax=Desulfurococcus amylolyticus DSM 16532 TaxID=768672 RepID=I3XRA2_DESAM|nr:hypothetical protein [Desulfurococcus amylolyticus]AFL66476.1 hypothetical protein Desfe_0575 [Desulfurococcus amylolyticus DSM 16532]